MARKKPAAFTTSNSNKRARDEQEDLDGMFLISCNEAPVELTSSLDQSGNKAPKRPRTKKVATRPGKGSRNAGKLKDAFEKLSEDLWFEILGQLPLETLCTLLKVNRLFRDNLLSSGFLFVWRDARLHRGIPEPPFRMSEPKWAVFLFESHKCEACSRARVHQIDFALLRRLCRACIKKETLTRTQIRSQVPVFKKTDIDLFSQVMAPTFVDNQTPRFAEAEVAKIAEECEKRGITLEVYAKREKEAITQRMEHARRCKTWYLKEERARSQELSDTRASRLEAIQARLFEMGYSEDDIAIIHIMDTVHKCTQLTDRSWNNIKDEMVQLIQRRRVEWMFNEHDCGPELNVRRNMMQMVYTRYEKSLDLTIRRYLPSLHTLSLLPSICPLLGKPDSDDVTAGDIEHLISTGIIQEEVDALLLEQLNRLKIDVADINVAAHVICCRCYSSHGSFLSAFRHWRSGDCPERTHFTRFSGLKMGDPTLVHDLQQAAGEDYKTADEFDDAGKWFRCAAPFCGFFGTWRACISHCGSAAKDHWPEARGFELLKKAAASDTRESWACSHCTMYDGAGLTVRRAILDHVQKEHSILDPKVPEDFFFAKR
ncbi:hypothetical protein VNI00_007794 [Paramarasmius palmivorus]|uniref:F-box domain-containing protein n=1 Tax=Paramarasmius palmivorus TaxID=297713 RepID=A0AAW0CYV2_9AGAR